MTEKVDFGDDVYIASLREAGTFAGREGVVRGHTKPSETGCGPVTGARKGRHVDLAWSVYFPDTDEQVWFAPHLVRRSEPGTA